MVFHLKNYSLGYQIVSLALSEETLDMLMKKELSALLITQSRVILYPGEILLSDDIHLAEQFRCFNDYDVLAIEESGRVIRLYNDKSIDNFFFITGKCNSNCVMCPSPDASRKNASISGLGELLEIANHIPQDAPHLTITGGEPFLMGKPIFEFLNFLKEKFVCTEFLILTNGRIFAIEEFAELLHKNMPNNTIVAIPIHGSNKNIHDAITRAQGSFAQTTQGIRNLLKKDVRVEIRIVVSRLNLSDFSLIANYIVRYFKGIEYISVIAMEMTGNARKNADILWLPYKEVFSKISSGITTLIENGVNVKLYNFPICSVDLPFRTLCEKSISPNKVRFSDVCKKCTYQTACGGVFAGTYPFEISELEAIL